MCRPSIALAFVAGASAQIIGSCPLLGKAYPAATNPSSTNAIRDAQASFASVLAKSLMTGMTDFGPLDNKLTTFSISVFSSHEKKPLFEFHHQAESGPRPTAGNLLNGDSLYRIGSVTKVHAIYAILAKLGDQYWDQPITLYIPELKNAEASHPDGVKWSEVTLGMLATHLSGVTRDYALRDISTDLTSPLPQLGFPQLNATDKITCGSFGLKPCTRDESIALLINSHSVTGTSQTPIYSNAAYGLLGLALESITGSSFDTIFQDGIVAPLGLRRTFWSLPPSDANAVIPGDVNSTWWNYDLGQDKPAGNSYQSIGDLAKLGQSILASTLLPESTSRSWLKPTTHSNTLYGSAGKAWEIVRIDLPLSTGTTATRVVDLYSKAGGIGAYGGLLMLSPDHDIGFAILAAGPSPGFPGQVPVLTELDLDTWMPAAEAAAREEARAKFAGKYGGSNNSSVTLALDPARPGLVIQSWFLNGLDLLQILGLGSGGVGIAAQLFPMELGDGKSKIIFRATLQVVPSAPFPTFPKPPQYLRPCSTQFLEVDTQRYGGLALDEFVLELGSDGVAKSLSIPVLRTASYGKYIKL